IPIAAEGEAGLTKDYYLADGARVELQPSSDLIAIGRKAPSSSDTLLPPELTLVREITPTVKEYRSSAPLSDTLIANITQVPDVTFTTQAFMVPSSKSDAVLLDEIIVALKPNQDPAQFFAAHPIFSTYRHLDG